MTLKIQDIARLAGVSTATVSRVFNNHPNIREEVRRRVVQAAKQGNYRPRLSTRQRNVVVISPFKRVYPVQSYVEMVLSELTEALAAGGYRIEILPPDNLDQLERIQFCGAFSIGYDGAEIANWDRRFAVPLVLIDREAPAGVRKVHSVASDEAQGMRLAIEHLAQSGCRKVGTILYGHADEGNVARRREGALRALRALALPAAPRLVRTALPEAFLEETGKLLQQGIDGLFAPGGNAGPIVTYALNLYGRRIPEDISLVTSERTFFSRYALPPQTTITQDYAEVARKSLEILDAGLAGPLPPARVVIPYRLVPRDSVRTPAE